MLEPFTGVIVIVSTPLGKLEILKNTRIIVSPPDNAVALPSAVLSFFLILLIVAAVAFPLF